MIYNIPPHRRGDTWPGINSIVISVNDTPISLSARDAEIKMEFREDIDSPPVLTLSTGDGTIVIAPGDIIRIPPKTINIPFGKYQYDLQITFANNGEIKTYMSGTWEIVPDITH